MLEPATLVIPTVDRPDLLAGALASALASEPPLDEILVVDQSAACDGRVERLAEASGHPVRHVHATVRGVSRARNLGARLARSEVLLFMDDDALVDSAWSRALRAALAAAPRAVITGRYEATMPEQRGAFAPSTTSGDEPHTFTEPGDVDVLYSGSMAIRRSTLAGIGGFDERLGPGTRYPSAEDNDLAHRLLVGGVPIMYEPAAHAHHRAWRPPRDLAGVRWRYGRGQGAFLAKHLTDGRGRTSARLRSHLLRSARRAARSLASPVLAVPDVAYLAGLLVGSFEWILRERVIRGDNRPGR